MNSLTLQWYDAEQLKVQVQKIEIPEFQAQEFQAQKRYNQQSSKNPGTYRIGRDPSRCDLVLGNPTVSGLHVEIFFDSQQQGFFIRNLRQSNPPLVDDKQLLDNVLPLFEGSTIYLGQQELKVAAVSIVTV
ncbi:MAG: FHA domain-containing protein, partial [Cyanobacteria bacterium J06639_18]